MENYTPHAAFNSISAKVAYMSDEERGCLLEAHPILGRNYRLHTPMIERTYLTVRERVWARRPGVVFYASPRMGKSSCAAAVLALIEAEFPRCHITLMSAARGNRNSDAHLLREVLEAESHVLARRADAGLLRELLKKHIQAETGSKGGSQYVLIIDELQLLNQMDLEQLLILHNKLDLEKIRMTTIAFAQPEILHLRSALATTSNRQIIARFLSETLPYDGCRTEKELIALLEGYDEGSEFPEASGWSYTRYFVPCAFAEGFRLKNYAAKIWTTLSLAGENLNAGSLPMEHVCLTIEYLLLSSRHRDAATLDLSEDDVRKAVDASNLKSFSGLMNG
jgi:hypothetical protein